MEFTSAVAIALDNPPAFVLIEYGDVTVKKTILCGIHFRSRIYQGTPGPSLRPLKEIQLFNIPLFRPDRFYFRLQPVRKIAAAETWGPCEICRYTRA